MQDARDNGRTRAHKAKPTTAVAIPPRTIPRRLRHMDSDAQWAERTTQNRLSCTAADAAFRLRGFADVLRSLGLSVAASRNDLHKHSFLSDAIDDIALALEEAHKAAWDASEAEGARPSRRAEA